MNTNPTHRGHYLGGRYKMERKYELTDETIEFEGHILHRIRALRDIRIFVNKGDLGGWVESEYNLSQDGNCWIFHESKVFGNALVKDSACTLMHSVVHDKAVIEGKAIVENDSRVGGFAKIFGNASIEGCSSINGDACIGNMSRIIDSIISVRYDVDGSLCMKINYGRIVDTRDYIAFTGFGSEHRTTQMYSGQDGCIHVSCGCFHGTLKEFKNKIKTTNEWFGIPKETALRFRKEYLECIRLAKIHFGINLLTPTGRILYGYRNDI